MKPLFTPRRQDRGASLIEVLVSVLIVTFGILAMAALQANSVKYNKSSEFRSVATLLAKDMADRMRANITGVKSGSYNMVVTTYADSVTATINAAVADKPTCLNPNSCTPAEMAAFDLAQWQRNLFFGLPQTAAYIQYNAASPTVGGSEYADLWVVWDDTTGSSGGGAAMNPGANGCPPWTAAGTPTYNCLYFRVAL